MPLSPEAVEEFRQIYAEERGELLAVEEAQTKADDLIALVRMLMHTKPGEVDR